MMSTEHNEPLTLQERELGMDQAITRRDFVNSVTLGAGLALLGAAAPSVKAEVDGSSGAPAGGPWHPWTGYGGVGDYAGCNGNTWDVVSAGHGLRDRTFEPSRAAATAGETYDLVVVGGGFAGVIAAYTFVKNTQRRRDVLLLDNHPLIGGEAKRNEFIVRGQRLMGPQGSNETDLPTDGWRGEMWRDVGLPLDVNEFEFGKLTAARKHMEFPLDNYHYYFTDNSENYGFHFDHPKPHWVTNPWGRELKGTPWPAEVRRDLLRWRDEPAMPFDGDDASLERWLDTMTYETYLTKVRGFHPEVARYVDPLLASGVGLGSDALSAYVAYYFEFSGFQGLSRNSPVNATGAAGRKLADVNSKRTLYSFPGGNDGLMRALVKWLNPEAIDGTTSFADVHNGKVRSEALDRPGIPCRMRTGATVVRVDHDPEDARKPATITYLKDNQLLSVKARTVIYAGASWTAKHAVQNLPSAYRAAMASFPRSPILVVNVALDNWRALYRLGYTMCSWRGGFGFTGNLRAPMYVGDYRPPLDPDSPAVFTLYVPFNEPGMSLVEQGVAGRTKMFGTSYRDYEMQIRHQLAKLFGSAGFDPKRDIAGIILNRWGHAYVNAGPGFFFGRDGKPTASDILRRPLGNLTFAHSELSGHQTYSDAGEEGRRAALQVLNLL